MIYIKFIGATILLCGIVMFAFWLKEELEFRKLKRRWRMTPENMKRRGYNEDGSKNDNQ